MQRIDGRPVYSATDLVGFLECEYLTALERAALADLVERPTRTDPELEVIRRRGAEHERRYLAELTAEGRRVVEIALDASEENDGARLRRAAAETEAAMASGAEVIYQATFFDGTWRGHADFLLRRDLGWEQADRFSRWGAYHYEVADTKLARHVKASAVLQICTYTDLLTVVQGVEPECLYVVLGGSARETKELPVSDYMAYYRAAKARFEHAVGLAGDGALPAADYPPPAPMYPEPVAHCEVCRWSAHCEAKRRTDDDLSLVAGISRRQRRGLKDRGVVTLTRLAGLELPMVPAVDGTSPTALARVHDQARIQRDGRQQARMLYELLEPPPGELIDPERGLATLPAPSAGDLFFDIEGDPYALDDGLDYLFGVMDTGEEWHAIWSTDARGDFSLEGEKRGFEAVVDLFIGQIERFPDAHIYHYATYEPTALKRLMGRHATREAEVDRLLRGGAFVDLFRAVRQGLRASVESYSIKKMEPFYGFVREIDLRDAGSSIVAFEEWLQLGEGERPAADHLARIERYNHDDVVSTRQLRDWLEERRRELAEKTGLAVPRPQPRDPEPGERLAAALERVRDLTDALTAGVPADPADRSPAQQARWLLAQLLAWHWREDKSFWWLYYHLRDDLDDDGRVEADEPIGNLTHEGPAGTVDRSVVHRYRFPPQEHKIRPGTGVRDPATGRSPGIVVAVDDRLCVIDLKRGLNSAVPHPRSLIPYEHFTSNEQEGALQRLAQWVVEHGLDADGPHRAALDLLLRRPPRAGQRPRAALRGADEGDKQAARRLGMALDRTTLAIQGPPGSGKTWTGAQMVLDLVKDGKRVGVTANSHKVISHFLKQVCAAAGREGLTIPMVQRGDDGEVYLHPMVSRAANNTAVRDALVRGSAVVAGGTAWLWAPELMAGSVDVLFVDEAGQMALANALAVSQAAGSLVLLGDPQQLDQPLKGSHPPGADRSALGHLLGEHATLPNELGLFLETTWRLHPDLCRFTSETFYESRLEPMPKLANQEIATSPPFGGTGPRFVGVTHAGNDHDSAEEAAEVAAIVERLVADGAWVDENGVERRIGWEDVLVVAPYNAQVGMIQRRLPQARVGTVDKFQGQEAPISVYSMTSSSVEDAPRGMAFLYSGHRLNVATSRARCVAVVVASPELIRVAARTPEQMRLANALCRFVELAPKLEAGPLRDVCSSALRPDGSVG